MHHFSLEVIKAGILLDTISITKPLLKFGRHPDSDIVLDHTSCSRNHANLEEKKDDKTKKICLFITDCGSTHGTFLNKTRLESNKPFQLENGFHIQFGESSRSFVVCCKSVEIQKDNILTINENIKSSSTDTVLGTEYEEDETEEYLQDDDDNIGLSMLHGKVIKGKKNKSNKLSWFDDLDATQLNEKEQILFDRILSLRMKSDNFSLEIERIRSKEDPYGGRSLTEGQMKQIAKNESAIDSYQERIVSDLDSLKKKLIDRQSNLISGIEKTKQGKGEQGESRNSGQKRAREEDIDDSNSLLHDAVARDEKINSKGLLDLSNSRITPSFRIRTLGTAAAEMSKKGSTMHTKSATSSGLVETAESLKIKLKEIVKAIEALENEAKETEIVNDGKEHREPQTDEDPLDAFMSTMTSIQCQQTEALSVKRNEQLLLLRREEARVRDLLNFATSSSLVLKSVSENAVSENAVSENEIHSHSAEKSNIDAVLEQRDINLKATSESEREQKDNTVIGPQVAPHHNKKGSTTSGLASAISLFQTHSMPPPPPRPAKSVVNVQLQEQQQQQQHQHRQQQQQHQQQDGIELEDGITAKVSLPMSLLSGVGFTKSSSGR